jgi:hypothetical protein
MNGELASFYSVDGPTGGEGRSTSIRRSAPGCSPRQRAAKRPKPNQSSPSTRQVHARAAALPDAAAANCYRDQPRTSAPTRPRAKFSEPRPTRIRLPDSWTARLRPRALTASAGGATSIMASQSARPHRPTTRTSEIEAFGGVDSRSASPETTRSAVRRDAVVPVRLRPPATRRPVPAPGRVRVGLNIGSARRAPQRTRSSTATGRGRRVSDVSHQPSDHARLRWRGHRLTPGAMGPGDRRAV